MCSCTLQRWLGPNSNPCGSICHAEIWHQCRGLPRLGSDLQTRLSADRGTRKVSPQVQDRARPKERSILVEVFNFDLTDPSEYVINLSQEVCLSARFAKPKQFPMYKLVSHIFWQCVLNLLECSRILTLKRPSHPRGHATEGDMFFLE